MTDTLPDRLSNDPRSPYHDEALLERYKSDIHQEIGRAHV